MTIQAHFEMGSERIIVRVINEVVLFIDPQTNMVAPIEGLNLNKKGVEKEYPDLVGDKNWKQKAVERFVEKVKSFPNERKRMDWIIKELKEMGYKPLFEQKNGFRPKKLT